MTKTWKCHQCFFLNDMSNKTCMRLITGWFGRAFCGWRRK